MANMGKVRRVVRELVAVLVDELGPEKAADLLKTEAARLRDAGPTPLQATTLKEARLQTGRKTAQVIEFKR